MAGGSVSFYEVAAQVIPVLVLVILIEQRAHPKIVGPLADFFVVLLAVLAASLAEFVALHDVYRSAGARTDQYFVIFPLVYLAVVIVAPVIATSLRELEAVGGKFSRAVAYTSLVLFLWLVVVLGLAVRY